ncbi:MAG: xanthine dehydrogenase family protein subunit M [Rhizobiaceae bacterium]
MYERPASLDKALSSLAAGEKAILAGGTDFYPMLGERQPSGAVVDITGLAELRYMKREPDGWHIGALATWTDIVQADLPPAFDGLKLAAREVGSIQIQNRATVAGNLCNASPAADGVPPLLTLDAEIQLSSLSGSRRIALSDFIDGYRSTVLQPGELVTAIVIPEGSAAGRSSFLKLGARKYLVISIAMVASRLVIGTDDTIVSAAVSVGACSEVAQRLGSLEGDLLGADVSKGFSGLVRPEHLAGLSPISDVRATNEYRHIAAAELVERVLDDCVLNGAAK